MGYEQLKLSNQVCFRLYTASRLVIQAYKPFFDELGITYAQYLVLMVLWETDHLPVNYIAKRLVLETNTVTPLIKRMESLGFVSRAKSETDSRSVIISLTERGRKTEEAASKIPNCMVDILKGSGVDDQKLVTMIPGLDSIIDSLAEMKMKDLILQKLLT